MIDRKEYDQYVNAVRYGCDDNEFPYLHQHRTPRERQEALLGKLDRQIAESEKKNQQTQKGGRA